MLGASIIATNLMAATQRREERNSLWEMTPEEERSALLDKWERQDRENRDHRRALEIAEAGRARNFWGE